MNREKLTKRLRARTGQTLPADWKKERKCPGCGANADRQKCMWDMGGSCPRHDPDNYEPSPWVLSPDATCAAAADLIDQQAARIAELETERDEYVFGKSFAERWNEDLDKIRAERDEARARFNDKDLCLHGQAPCEDLLAAERTAYSAGWIAGRDAAADDIDCGCAYREQAIASTKHGRYSVCQQGECLARLAADIRALTPPEDKS